MALSGNLHDFDISYIFQIISQEGKTGKLILSSDDTDGIIVFKQGKIIYAGTNKENLQSMLYKYLRMIHKCPESEIKEIRALYHNNLGHLCHEVLERGYISSQELSIITELTVEDIACSIFLWKQGNYQFDTLPNVDIYQIGNYSLSSDALTMEAARRLDERQRNKSFFTKNTVFIHTDSVPQAANKEYPDPLSHFSDFLLDCIDGTSSTEFLCQKSFLSEYQVYQALYELIEEKKITPLPDAISSSINAALKRTDSSDMDISKILLSSIITATCIAVIYFLGTIIVNEVLFSKSIAERHHVRSELIRAQSNQKIAIATLQYQANNGTPPLSFRDLVRSGSIGKRDLAVFTASSSKEKVLQKK